MNRARLPWILCLALLSPRLAAQEPVSFVRDIKPLLKERCFSCHGSLKQKGDLRLDTVALMKEGGKSGPALLPGQAEKSLLVERLTAVDPAKRMPPRNEAEPLNPQQIAKIRAWIDQGAKAPAGEKAEADPKLHWAFRAPLRPALPAVKRPEWSRNPIDAFIAAEHEKLALTPQPPAEKELLLRRVYLDLIGLPPTRAELHAFVADASPTAYEKVVDQLLSRPQYGERWARHWMDVWRYSDWYGRRAEADVRNSAPQIWRWRDWIIKSLNDDRGYDRMVQEMLAADEIAPEDDDAAAATGYIVRNWYALNPHQWMRDMVEHTGKAFLGLTFNCCHCHDHKYDPISQEEYFGMRAFFEPLGVRQDRVPGQPDPGPFQKYDYAASRKAVKVGMVRAYDENLDVKTLMYQQGDERLKIAGKAPIQPTAPAFLGGNKLLIEPVSLPALVLNPTLKPWFQKDELAQREKSLADARSALAKAETGKDGVALARLQVEIAEAQLSATRSRFAAENVKLKKVSGNLDDLARAASKSERTLAWVLARDKQLRAEQALIPARKKLADAAAGKIKDAAAAGLKKAEQLATDAAKAVDKAAQALAAESKQYTATGGPNYPATSTGRRKALALWITGKDNPLAARVAVNHVWLRHFDRALVDTVFDFGRNGKKPSHPELLDWLAVEFMESGWSMKKLHRLIVTSQTYRMQSGGAPSESDPDNRYLARFPARRMEAEAVRDTLLYLGGELDLQIGGPPIENVDEPKSKRRGMYFSVYPEDGGSARFLEIFDAPDPCDCYKRTASIIPQQALALTNNQLALNQSRRLARKLSPDAKDDKAFIVAAFEQVLCRRPSSDEEALCLGFLRQQVDLFRKTDAATLAAPPPAGILAPSAELTLRARESLVRTLFSHSDFVTIR